MTLETPQENLPDYSDVIKYKTLKENADTIDVTITKLIKHGWELLGPPTKVWNNALIVQTLILRKDNADKWYAYLKDKPRRVLASKIGYIVSMTRRGVKEEDAWAYYEKNYKSGDSEEFFRQLYPIAIEKYNTWYNEYKDRVFTAFKEAEAKGLDIDDVPAMLIIIEDEYGLQLSFSKAILFLKYYKSNKQK